MISERDSAFEYALSASAFKVANVVPHLNFERIFKAFDVSPKIYKAAARASAVESFVGFPKFTGLAGMR